MIELGSRRVVHFGVTRSPSDAWVTQQLREATPSGEGPHFLICDNDGKFGDQFERIAEGTGIEVIHTPVEAPRANPFCERVRREAVWITVQEVLKQTFNEPAVPSAVL